MYYNNINPLISIPSFTIFAVIYNSADFLVVSLLQILTHVLSVLFMKNDLRMNYIILKKDCHKQFSTYCIIYRWLLKKD